MNAELSKAVFEQYGPQLGEMLWYAINIDPRIDDVSNNRVEEFKRIIKTYGCRRILELAPFAHYTGHVLSGQHEVALCDISARSLRVGADLGTKAGHEKKATMVAADFHDLPFDDGSFDFVFIASAIHHTTLPERVLSEISRILCKGGVFYLFNEPCQRHFSFFKFRANRLAALSPAERQLQERGVLRLITSYLAFSRPEELFGMVENNRIPLATYTNALKEFDILHSKIDWKAGLSEFDRNLVARAQRGTLSNTEIANAIRDALKGVTVSSLEQIRGVKLPSEEEIDSLANDISEKLAIAVTDHEMADIFGAALQMIVRKRTGEELKSSFKVHGDYELKDRVYCSKAFPISGTEYELDVSGNLLPQIQFASNDELASVFPASDWRVECSERGIISLAPRVPEPVIRVENAGKVAVLIRLFANFPGDYPYSLVISPKNGENIQIEVAAAESRLARFVASDASRISFVAKGLDGSSFDRPPPIRVQAVQAVELKPCGLN